MKISFTKTPESDFFFIENPNLTKKKKIGRWEGRGWGCGCFSKSEKNFFFFFF